ncbi:MAG TPA: zinc ribbon domain-containing protein [Dehalococcoidia bacterium]|nr:zinc ribbon domain-containing protein [Dehalococcoidia bacterium]
MRFGGRTVMPIYEYSCGKCGNKFESLARSADEAEPVCPRCGRKQVKRNISGFSSSSSGCGPAASQVASPAPRHFG